MADKFDILMRTIADEADAKVDYAAMREAILQKSAAEKRRRARFLRYGTMAASFAILLGAGTLFASARGGLGGASNEAKPQAAESHIVSGSGTAADAERHAAPQGLPEQEADSVTAEQQADANGFAAADETAGAPREEYSVSEAAPEPKPAATGAPGIEDGRAYDSAALTEEGIPGVAVWDVDALLALYSEAESMKADEKAALPAAEWLYAPEAAPDGYRLLEIRAGAEGVTYRYNKAAADAYNDEYALFIPAASLSGAMPPLDGAGAYAPPAEAFTAGEDALSWPLGDGVATLTPAAGCTLSLAELQAYCALRLLEIGE